MYSPIPQWPDIIETRDKEFQAQEVKFSKLIHAKADNAAVEAELWFQTSKPLKTARAKGVVHTQKQDPKVTRLSWKQKHATGSKILKQEANGQLTTVIGHWVYSLHLGHFHESKHGEKLLQV